jgi:hypothetical protein
MQSLQCPRLKVIFILFYNCADDDAFASNAIGGILSWTLPSAMDIYSSPATKYTYYDFDNTKLPFGST